MFDPDELSQGVDVRDVRATMLRGRSTLSTVCRPIPGDGDVRDQRTAAP